MDLNRLKSYSRRHETHKAHLHAKRHYVRLAKKHGIAPRVVHRWWNKLSHQEKSFYAKQVALGTATALPWTLWALAPEPFGIPAFLIGSGAGAIISGSIHMVERKKKPKRGRPKKTMWHKLKKIGI